jgi:hypothetical protein
MLKDRDRRRSGERHLGMDCRVEPGNDAATARFNSTEIRAEA